VRIGQHGFDDRNGGLDVGTQTEEGGLDDPVLITGRTCYEPVE
jgi:hypothetical protein